MQCTPHTRYGMCCDKNSSHVRLYSIWHSSCRRHGNASMAFFITAKARMHGRVSECLSLESHLFLSSFSFTCWFYSGANAISRERFPEDQCLKIVKGYPGTRTRQLRGLLACYYHCCPRAPPAYQISFYRFPLQSLSFS